LGFRIRRSHVRGNTAWYFLMNLEANKTTAKRTSEKQPNTGEKGQRRTKEEGIPKRNRKSGRTGLQGHRSTKTYYRIPHEGHLYLDSLSLQIVHFMGVEQGMGLDQCIGWLERRWALSETRSSGPIRWVGYLPQE